ncbi:uncharacterized protein LOC124270776 [Haliotis rubra]|uniref:uncharacterized protein LOC124270776 n=1 Tax=Haliotis rubra TaxID=36100 RepID=UPI001EE5AF64|nr:uncharacterized protein LOC124270776 [Haliotis rubra]
MRTQLLTVNILTESTVEADAAHKLPIVEIQPDFKDMDAEDIDDMAPSHNTNRDEAMLMLSALLRRGTLSVREDTMHNVHTAQRRPRHRVSDETHLHKWLSMPNLPVTSGNLACISHTSPEDPPTPFGDPTLTNRIRRSASDITHQRKRSLSKQNKNPVDYRCMTHQGEQMLSRGQHIPQRQGHTIQPAFVSQSTDHTEGLSVIPQNIVKSRSIAFE